VTFYFFAPTFDFVFELSSFFVNRVLNGCVSLSPIFQINLQGIVAIMASVKLNALKRVGKFNGDCNVERWIDKMELELCILNLSSFCFFE
jgi:hypothetical protein